METKEHNPVDVLAIMDRDRIESAAARFTFGDREHSGERLAMLEEAKAARDAVAELIAADKEFDNAAAALRALARAGRRPHSHGTGWELRDEATRRELEKSYDAACERRAAALSRIEVKS